MPPLGEASCREPRSAMRRRQKRLLQVAGLLVAAFLFLPNVGLWSLYRDRVFDNSPDAADGPGGVVRVQVRKWSVWFVTLLLVLLGGT